MTRKRSDYPMTAEERDQFRPRDGARGRAGRFQSPLRPDSDQIRQSSEMTRIGWTGRAPAQEYVGACQDKEHRHASFVRRSRSATRPWGPHRKLEITPEPAIEWVLKRSLSGTTRESICGDRVHSDDVKSWKTDLHRSARAPKVMAAKVPVALHSPSDVSVGSIASVGLSWHVGFPPTPDVSLRRSKRRFGQSQTLTGGPQQSQRRDPSG